MKRKALGRGLDALLPDKGEGNALIQLDIEKIKPNPLQPRVHFRPEKLDELAQSLKEKGLLQPIVVRPVDSEYEIIAGERRWRAAQKAGLKRIPALIQTVSDEEMLELALIENIQRDDLSPIEEANAYQIMANEFDLTQEQIAARVGRSRTAVANTLRLLQLPSEIQILVTESRLSMGHARALIPLPKKEQLSLGREIVKKDLSVRVTESRVRQLLQASQQKPARPARRDPNVAAAERRLEEHFGTKVEIKQRGKAGRILLHYNDADELERIYESLLRP